MRAIVVGAGIGGLTAGIALRRAGVDALVLERSADVQASQVGAGLTLAYNATRAYDHIGLGDRLADAGTLYKAQEFRSQSGKLLARWYVPDTERQVGITRSALHGLLIDALGSDSLRLGAECAGFEQNGDGVTVRLADGSEERCDFLVGADGLRSTIRRQVLGAEEERYAGYTVWRALVRFQHEEAPPGLFRMVWGRGKRFCFYQVGDGQMYWFGVADAPAGESEPKGSRKQGLLERFAGYPTPTRELISSAPEEAIHRTDIYDREPVERWGDGRVTLLGDAAHPMTFNLGQGACQAIESAVILANHMEGASDVAPALRAYEAERMPRTKEVTDLSWRIGAAGRLKRRPATWLRDTIMSLTFERFVVPKQEKSLEIEF